MREVGWVARSSPTAASLRFGPVAADEKRAPVKPFQVVLVSQPEPSEAGGLAAMVARAVLAAVRSGRPGRGQIRHLRGPRRNGRGMGAGIRWSGGSSGFAAGPRPAWFRACVTA